MYLLTHPSFDSGGWVGSFWGPSPSCKSLLAAMDSCRVSLQPSPPSHLSSSVGSRGGCCQRAAYQSACWRCRPHPGLNSHYSLCHWLLLGCPGAGCWSFDVHEICFLTALYFCRKWREIRRERGTESAITGKQGPYQTMCFNKVLN